MSVADGALGRPGKANRRTPGMHVDGKSDGSVMCAEQRVVQEGWSPSDAQMRGVISKDGGNSSSARASALEGRVSTVKWDPKGMRRSIGPQSMEATPKMNRSAKGGTRSSLHYRGEGVLIHPPYQGVCG